MPDEHADPSGTTDQFRAFVADPTPEPKQSRTPLIVAGAVAVVVVLAILVWLAVG